MDWHAQALRVCVRVVDSNLKKLTSINKFTDERILCGCKCAVSVRTLQMPSGCALLHMCGDCVMVVNNVA